MKATLRDLAGVGLKLLGVYAAFLLTTRLNNFILSPLFQGGASGTALLVGMSLLGTNVLLLAFTAALLGFTDATLTLLFGEGPHGTIEDLSQRHVMGFAFLFAGVLVFTICLGNAVSIFGNVALAKLQRSSLPYSSLRTWLPLTIKTSLQVALGIGCVIYGALKLRSVQESALSA